MWLQIERVYMYMQYLHMYPPPQFDESAGGSE